MLDPVNRVVLLCGEIGGDAGEGRQAHSSSPAHHSIGGRDVQAIFFRRRHHPRSPPPAKIRPGSPAPHDGTGDSHAGERKTRVKWSLVGDVGADPLPVGLQVLISYPALKIAGEERRPCCRQP